MKQLAFAVGLLVIGACHDPVYDQQGSYDQQPVVVGQQPYVQPVVVHDSVPWWVLWHSSQPTTVVHEHYHSSGPSTVVVHTSTPAPAAKAATPVATPVSRPVVQNYVSKPAPVYRAPVSAPRVQSYVSRPAPSYSRPMGGRR